MKSLERWSVGDWQFETVEHQDYPLVGVRLGTALPFWVHWELTANQCRHIYLGAAGRAHAIEFARTTGLPKEPCLRAIARSRELFDRFISGLPSKVVATRHTTIKHIWVIRMWALHDAILLERGKQLELIPAFVLRQYGDNAGYLIQFIVNLNRHHDHARELSQWIKEAVA